MTQSTMLRVPAVAKMLNCSPETIRRYVRSGKLRACKPGGKLLLFDIADVERFTKSK